MDSVRPQWAPTALWTGPLGPCSLMQPSCGQAVGAGCWVPEGQAPLCLCLGQRAGIEDASEVQARIPVLPFSAEKWGGQCGHSRAPYNSSLSLTAWAPPISLVSL